MSLRARELYETADSQIAELTARLSSSTSGAGRLDQPCPGRGKLGDGTIAAVAAHTADNYRRIAQFVADIGAGGGPRFPDHHGAHHPPTSTSTFLLTRLEAAQHAIAPIRELGDDQLDSVPPAGQMRFADGERTLEQVLTSLLRHQRHQVDAVATARSGCGCARRHQVR